MISTGTDAVGVEVPLTEGPVQKIILYRALLKDNLIAIFKDPKIPHIYLGVTLLEKTVGREREMGLNSTPELIPTNFKECLFIYMCRSKLLHVKMLYLGITVC